MNREPVPTSPRVRPRGKHLLAVIGGTLWRVLVMRFAWALAQVYVWVRERLGFPKWLGTDLREVSLRLWSVFWLAFVWVLLWGNISWANVLAGIVLALAVIFTLPLPRVPVEGRLHPISALGLVLTMMWNFLKSSIQVGWAAVRPGRPPMGAVIRVRMAIKSDLVLTLAIDYINLVPGTIVVEIDHRRRVLYIHVFDVRTDKQVAAFHKQIRYTERAFIRAFERDNEWHPSPYHGIDDDYHHVSDADRERVSAQATRGWRRITGKEQP